MLCDRRDDRKTRYKELGHNVRGLVLITTFSSMYVVCFVFRTLEVSFWVSKRGPSYEKQSDAVRKRK